MPRQLDLFRYEVRIPTFDWKQIGGDMDPGAHGGTIARADGSSIELLKIQPVRAYVGDGEAAEVGFPFWTTTSYFDESDLQTDNKTVIKALTYIGVWDNDDQLQAFKEAAPEDRAVLIAEALMDYGSVVDEGTAGWAKDVLGSIEVEWWGSPGKKIGYEYIADEDEEFEREVLGALYWDDVVGDVAADLERIRDEIAGYEDPEIQETDVRLQVHDGSWSVHSGDSQYDQDHRGHWGSSGVSVDDSDETLLETARALVEEAKDAWYEDHPNVPSRRHTPNAGRRGEVIESRRWRNRATGATASLYGAVPWTGAPGNRKSDWEVETVGYTIQWSDGTIGTGRLPFKTEREAEEFLQKFGARGGMRPNARGGALDEQAATELELYIENDYELVGAPNSKGKMIEQNLLKKIKQGKYDFSLSVKLWEYLIEDGARKYAKEFASADQWSRIFSPATRRYVAERFARSFAQEHGVMQQNGRATSPKGGSRLQPNSSTCFGAGLIKSYEHRGFRIEQHETTQVGYNTREGEYSPGKGRKVKVFYIYDRDDAERFIKTTDTLRAAKAYIDEYVS